MTSLSRSWRADTSQADLPNPLHGLVELLLDLLLNDVPASTSAQLTIQPNSEPSGSETPRSTAGSSATGSSAMEAGSPAPPAQPYLERGDPDLPGHLVTASSPLADGGTVTLSVRGELTDDGPTQAWLRRFIQPMVACVDLESRLDEQTGRARDALAEIERRAITDLATGIVMARRDCDPATARARLAAWGARTGVDLQVLSAAKILELLTADQP
jgi:hypothetical protein